MRLATIEKPINLVDEAHSANNFSASLPGGGGGKRNPRVYGAGKG